MLARNRLEAALLPERSRPLGVWLRMLELGGQDGVAR